MRSILLLLMIAAAFLSGCSSTKNIPRVDDLPLKETRWEIYSINKNVIDSPRIYIVLKASGKFSGNAGCNSMGGGYSEENSKINFSGILSTKMYCNDMEKENMFLKALPASDTYFIHGSYLTILSNGNEILKFKGKTGP